MRIARRPVGDLGRGVLPSGYLLHTTDDTVDVGRFHRLVAQARAVAGDDPAGAARDLRLALGLWRGDAAADVDSRLVQRVAARLNEERSAVHEECIGLELRLGRHREVIGELSELVATYPLREKLWAQLMLALYRAGRPGEALAAYRTARKTISEELGRDPGEELRALEQAILENDEALDLPEVATAGPLTGAPVVPWQLPPPVRHFAGRAAELDVLSGLLDDVAQTAGTVLITAIDGTAGIGKTALAVYWAHQVADRFIDGQLYVNLRGFDPSRAQMTVAEAVRGFLDAFAVPPQRIPAGLDAQVALYRSLLAGKNVLVVLDNARDADQLRPLLPGAPGCVAVVTSRNQLIPLVAGEGAHPLPLDLLTRQEARDLLPRRLGADRITAEPGAVQAVISRCARLPLALAIVAARAATHPNTP